MCISACRGGGGAEVSIYMYIHVYLYRYVYIISYTCIHIYTDIMCRYNNIYIIIYIYIERESSKYIRINVYIDIYAVPVSVRAYGSPEIRGTATQPPGRTPQKLKHF